MTTPRTRSATSQSHRDEALHDDLAPELEALVRSKVNNLIAAYGFLRAEHDDLVQEITVDLLQRLKSYDPRRGSVLTFASRVIGHRIAYLLARQKATVKGCRLAALSIHDLPEEQCDEETSQQHEAHREAEDLRIDLEKTLSGLPQALSALCRLMRELAAEDHSPSACLTRKAFQAAAKKIGREFKRAGLHEYL